jgi:Ni/Co efflux regulator RcnB
MHRGYRFLSSMLLTAALAGPVAMTAVASSQDDHNQGNKQENRQNDNSKRYYDKSHKDYHTWDSNEDSAYQRYQTQHHEKRAFVQLSTRKQTTYWSWRHNNPDNK